jgi:uncharacterized protein YegL
MTEQLVLPFYVLADVSYSMTQKSGNGDGESPLDSLNETVVAVKDALDENPILGDKIRFSLIDFSDDARTQIPLCDLMKVPNDSIPKLTARGGTSFVAAFTAIRQQIEADIRQLKADNHKVHRPAVFFLTDGEPTDPDAEWQQAFAELTSSSFRGRPNVIPFGIGDAKKVVLDQLVYPAGKMRAFISKDGVKPSDAIRSMAEVLISSVIASANSISSDGETGGFVLPDDDEDDVWL